MSEKSGRKPLPDITRLVSFLGRLVKQGTPGALHVKGSDNTIIDIYLRSRLPPEHRFWMKVSLKEESSGCRLSLQSPGEKAGDMPFANCWICTLRLADLAGLKTSPDLREQSLARLFDDLKEITTPYAFSVSAEQLMFSFDPVEKWAIIPVKKMRPGIELLT